MSSRVSRKTDRGRNRAVTFEIVNALARGRNSGTGLGLPIVRLAVARMGGGAVPA